MGGLGLSSSKEGLQPPCIFNLARPVESLNLQLKWERPVAKHGVLLRYGNILGKEVAFLFLLVMKTPRVFMSVAKEFSPQKYIFLV